MGLNAVKFLAFDSTDLSAVSNTSEIADVRDLRTFVVFLNLTGAPTGTLNVIHYYGYPTIGANGVKTWANNQNIVAQTFSPAGAVKYIHQASSANGMPCSAVQIVYTKASGTGAIVALLQNKGSGSA